MTIIIDRLPFTPTAQFLDDARYFQIGKRRLKRRVIWYEIPRSVYQCRAWLDTYLLRLGFECAKDSQ